MLQKNIYINDDELFFGKNIIKIITNKSNSIVFQIRRDVNDKNSSMLDLTFRQTSKVKVKYSRRKRLYTVILDESINRDNLIKELLKNGIDTRPIFYPLNEMPPYTKLKKSLNLTNSVNCSYSGICLPTSPNMSDDTLNYVADKFNEITNLDI